MLKPAAATAQTELEMVTLDQLVPRDHLLRLIDTHIRFDFIREKTEGLYCANNGRPAIDPVVLFKMLFIGYLFGVRSERQLVREIEVNVAYRWFLGLRLTDKVPDASTLSQNRRRRFAGTGVEQDISTPSSSKRRRPIWPNWTPPSMPSGRPRARSRCAALRRRPWVRPMRARSMPSRIGNTAHLPPRPGSRRIPPRRTPVRSSAARSIPRRGSWCAIRNPSASSIWITAPSMACTP
jgi:transposase